MIATLLLAIAFVCLVLHAFGVTARINLQSAGLACWVLSILVGPYLP